MAIPRFRSQKHMKGRDANLILDAIDAAMPALAPDVTGPGNLPITTGVKAILPGVGVSVNQPSGNVILSGGGASSAGHNSKWGYGLNNTGDTTGTFHPNNPFVNPARVEIGLTDGYGDFSFFVSDGQDQGGAFTAPVAGVYLIQAYVNLGVKWPSVGVSDTSPVVFTASAYLAANVNRQLDRWDHKQYYGGGTTRYINLGGFCIFSLVAGEAVTMWVQVTADHGFGVTSGEVWLAGTTTNVVYYK